MKSLLFTLTLVLVFCAHATGSPTTNDATVAFQKLQALVGDWEGKDDHGMPVKTHFVLIASETAVMETLSMAGTEEMVTLYSVDKNSISLTHYCPTNNQPRMRAVPTPGKVKELVFSFQGAGNLPDPGVGHEHKLVIEFSDKDHIVERWTWRSHGKDNETVYHLSRKNTK